MPRPRKVITVSRIEGLSDGQDRRLVDDFTGEVLPDPQAGPRASAFDILDQANRDKATAQRAMLVKVAPKLCGLLPIPHKPFTRRV